MDALLLGRRIRFYRKEAGLTLDELSARVDRPTSYLSQLENGHVEARVGLLGELADSLGCTTTDLLIDDSPTRRDELEISVLRAQSDPRYLELGLAEFRPTAKTSDSALEHISGLYKALVGAEDRAGHRDGTREIGDFDPLRVALARSDAARATGLGSPASDSRQRRR